MSAGGEEYGGLFENVNLQTSSWRGRAWKYWLDAVAGACERDVLDVVVNSPAMSRELRQRPAFPKATETLSAALPHTHRLVRDEVEFGRYGS